MVNLRKFFSKRRDTSLCTGVIPYPVRNSQTSRFVSVPGQNSGKSSRGDRVGLRLQPVIIMCSLYVHSYVCALSISLSLCLSLSFCLSVCLSVSLSLSYTVCVCVFICVRVCLCLFGADENMYLVYVLAYNSF